MGVRGPEPGPALGTQSAAEIKEANVKRILEKIRDTVDDDDLRCWVEVDAERAE